MINTDELTVGQARELAKQFSSLPQSPTSHPTVGRYCVIRSYAAGVHVGIVKSVSDSLSGREVVLSDTRRIWSWAGALSCTEIAMNGISGGKVSVISPENFVNQVIEIIPMTAEAEKCLRSK